MYAFFNKCFSACFGGCCSPTTSPSTSSSTTPSTDWYSNAASILLLAPRGTKTSTTQVVNEQYLPLCTSVPITELRLTYCAEATKDSAKGVRATVLKVLEAFPHVRFWKVGVAYEKEAFKRTRHPPTYPRSVFDLNLRFLLGCCVSQLEVLRAMENSGIDALGSMSVNMNASNMSGNVKLQPGLHPVGSKTNCLSSLPSSVSSLPSGPKVTQSLKGKKLCFASRRVCKNSERRVI